MLFFILYFSWLRTPVNCLAHSVLEQETDNSAPFSVISIENRFWIKNCFELKRFLSGFGHTRISIQQNHVIVRDSPMENHNFLSFTLFISSSMSLHTEGKAISLSIQLMNRESIILTARRRVSQNLSESIHSAPVLDQRDDMPGFISLHDEQEYKNNIKLLVCLCIRQIYFPECWTVYKVKGFAGQSHLRQKSVMHSNLLVVYCHVQFSLLFPFFTQPHLFYISSCLFVWTYCSLLIHI